MVYRSSRRQAQRDDEPEGFQLQEPSIVMDKGARSRRQVGIWRAAAVLLAIVCIGLSIAVIAMATRGSEGGDGFTTCGRGQNAKSQGIIDRGEPDKPGPFHDLTKHEMRHLRSFLEQDPNIKAVDPDGATMEQSNIYMMDLFPAPKKAVLKYLDKNGPQPPRQARVLMYRGDLRPAVVEEYICGPLPDVRKCELLKSDKRRNPVEFALRPVGLMEFEAIYNYVLTEVDKKIGYILKETYGTSYVNCPPDECFKVYPSPIATKLVDDITKRRLWVWADYPVEYYALHPTDFGVLAVLDGSEPEKFYVDKVWYNGVLYDSMDDLIVKYNGTSPAQRYKLNKPKPAPEATSSLYLRGDPLPKEPQRPPTLVEPDGRRYSLKDRKVEYLGWTFNFRMSALTGPSLFDIRYKGERLAFELGMAEIAVYYSANNPLHRVTDFVDSGALIGSHSKSLVPGGDCPETATFINQTFSGQSTSEPVELARSFCLFENNNGYPLRRHLSYSQAEGAFYGGMMDSALVLRSALTIVNYDYIMDYIFHQNGVVETRVMSTGYILPSFYTSLEDPYGFEIEDKLLGNIHHHIFHFKADLDIMGTSNRYETLDIVPEAVDMRTVPGRKYHQTKYVRNLRKNEKEALYKYDFDTPKYHVVHNNAKKTKYNAIKAYRIAMHGMSKQMLPENEDNEGTVPWARHQLVVTKHKDNERVSSSPYAMWDSQNPVTDFTTFYEDNDNIVDEDLVFWITQGMHHIPHTEDIPLTPTVGNHLTFFLLPYNYFDECPSVASRDHIRIEHKNKKDPKQGVRVLRNGNSVDQCSLPPVAKEYDELLERDPDVILESTEFRGIF
ncbi:putative amine oxidase [copper-containing] [Aplysia californica]|uniref:Amine oxidase n=1 Tax=Aplysia californica TaxID=6500 RepID=A0ABM0JRP5_APLCA|nr:putative amine oxidase [copper-containing] [Aplysia californica]